MQIDNPTRRINLILHETTPGEHNNNYTIMPIEVSISSYFQLAAYLQHHDKIDNNGKIKGLRSIVGGDLG